MVGCSHIFLAKVNILGSRASRPPLLPKERYRESRMRKIRLFSSRRRATAEIVLLRPVH